MQILTMSEIQRNLHVLQNFDIIKVIDKRRNIVKGYLLSTKYQEKIEEIAKANKKKELKNFVGIWRDKDLDKDQIRKEAWR